MQENLSNYPNISETLIKKLKEDFPDEIPRAQFDAWTYGYLAGIQAVIDKLVFEYEEQQKNETEET